MGVGVFQPSEMEVVMSEHRFVTTDQLWQSIAPLLPGNATDRGVTARDNRLFLEAVLVEGARRCSQAKSTPFPKEGVGRGSHAINGLWRQVPGFPAFSSGFVKKKGLNVAQCRTSLKPVWPTATVSLVSSESRLLSWAIRSLGPKFNLY